MAEAVQSGLLTKTVKANALLHNDDLNFFTGPVSERFMPHF